ncbi:MAG: hypothetical protein FWD44_09205 [Oscillospiraceae bacterium]|nr:hypothetical protein [Oscillospiraceae bacterium]
MYCIYCRNTVDENSESVCSACGREVVNTAVNNPPPVVQQAPPPPPPPVVQPPPMPQPPPPVVQQPPPVVRQPQPVYAPVSATAVSPKKKAITMLLFLFVHIGLPYFYAGNTKKGMLYLLLYWPTMVLGWILFLVFFGVPLLIVNFILLIGAIRDFIKLVKGDFLDGDKLPIVV